MGTVGTVGTVDVKGGSDPRANGTSWLQTTEGGIKRAGYSARCSHYAAQITVNRYVLILENLQTRGGRKDRKF
jgi:hypothetical protein